MSWRNTRAYRVWRAQVIRRDKVCQVCGSNQKREAHHIDCGSYYPKQRYDIENGVCLCRSCHVQYHTNFNKSFKVKTNRYNWENFLTVIKYIKEKVCLNIKT